MRLLGTLLLATAAGAAAQALRLPLPWMVGPLLATALAGVSGVPLAASNRLRNAGQWAIGVSLGLYFTPSVGLLFLPLAPAIAAGVVWALLLGYGFHRWLAALNPAESAATTYYAAAIGGASEMAVLADRAGARVDRVAAAHSLRVLLVVLVLPLSFQLTGVHGADAAEPALRELRPGGLVVLTGLTLAGAALMRWARLPNPFVLGALGVTAALTLAGVELSALPRWASNAGQLFIGVALGTRFTPEFARVAPRWLLSVAGGTLAMLGVSAVFAVGLAALAGLHPATAILATSPGGIAEMCITAKVLELGVPVVTAFHVVRYVAVLLLTAPLGRRLGLVPLSAGRPSAP